MSIRNAVVVLFFLYLPFNAFTQHNWNYIFQINAGCNINLYMPVKTVTFPGIKVFVGGSVNGINKNFSLNYGTSFVFYKKMMGNHFNPLVDDNQIDFTNTFVFGYVGDKQRTYEKIFRTFGNSAFYNMHINRDWGAFLGTTFVLNNHKRNQTVGSISANVDNVSLFYANDGGTPLNYLPFSDQFDRWWTGSGGVFVHNKKGYNDFELTFDQFTGYTPLLYELSSMLGVNLPDYNASMNDSITKNAWSKTSFNTSSYEAKIFLDPNYAISAGVMGSLFFNDRYYGIQDLIHKSMGFSLHPNNDINRLYFGGTYNQLIR